MPIMCCVTLQALASAHKPPLPPSHTAANHNQTNASSVPSSYNHRLSSDSPSLSSPTRSSTLGGSQEEGGVREWEGGIQLSVNPHQLPAYDAASLSPSVASASGLTSPSPQTAEPLSSLAESAPGAEERREGQPSSSVSRIETSSQQQQQQQQPGDHLQQHLHQQQSQQQQQDAFREADESGRHNDATPVSSVTPDHTHHTTAILPEDHAAGERERGGGHVNTHIRIRTRTHPWICTHT